MIRSLFFMSLCAGLVLVQPLYGQVTYNKRQGGSVAQSPTQSDMSAGASLDQVEYITGTAKINIPLYTIKVKDITVPISISYSTHGRKIGEEMGPLGVGGWTLNAGGGISRQLNQLPDEDYLKGIGNNPLPFSSVNYSNSQCLNFTQELIDGKKDGAWDMLSYNLPDASGQFTADGLTFPYDPLINLNTYWSASGYYFYVTTANGLYYDFAEGDRKVFKRRRYYSQGSNPTWISINPYSNSQWKTDSIEYAENWNINSIQSMRYKDTVFFHYNSRFYDNIRTSSTEALPLINKAYTDGNTQVSSYGYYEIGYPIISQTRVRTSVHKQISSIDFPNGKVVFNFTPSDVCCSDLLSQILIQEKDRSGAYVTIRKFQFSYGSASGPTEPVSLSEIDAGNKTISIWQFTYNDNKGVGDLTDPDNKGQDWWGFYNGAVNNKTLLSLDSNLFLLANAHYPFHLKDVYNPTSFPVKRKEELLYYGFNSEYNIESVSDTRSDSHINFADRQAHFDYTVSNTLSSIILPTGAVVSYEYEPNKYYQTLINSGTWSSKIMTGAGLRIKSITTRDARGHLMLRKEYKYGWADPTTNQSWQTGYGYINNPGNILAVEDVYRTGATNYYFQALMLLSNPVNDIALYNGACAVYPTVGEYQYSDTSSSGGIVYFYAFNPPQDGWDVTNPTASNISLPKFYVNYGIRNYQVIGIPTKKIIEEYDKTYDVFYAKRIIQNHIQTFHSTKSGFVSYYAGIQAEITAVNGYLGTWCTFPPGANTELVCHDLYGIVGMDNSGLSNYTGDSYSLSQNAYFDGKYGYSYGVLQSRSLCYRIDMVTETDEDYPAMTSKTLYSFDNPEHLLPTRIKTLNSRGDTLIRHMRYAADFPNRGNNTPISNIAADLVEVISTIKPADGVEQVTGASLTMYTGSPINSSVDEIYDYNSDNQVIPYSSFTLFDGSTTKDPHYELRISYDYDSYGNPKLIKKNGWHKYTATWWGYHGMYPVAEMQGQDFDVGAVRYTSFEGNQNIGWNIPAGGVVAEGVTGKYAYDLSHAGSAGITGGAGSTQKFVVAYYSNSATPCTITGTEGTPLRFDMGSWHYYQHLISGVDQVKITGNCIIDELRLYTRGSALTTYTYDPLKGMTSRCEPNGKVSHFGYDNFSRLDKIWDDYKYLLKAYQYRYQAPVNQ